MSFSAIELINCYATGDVSGDNDSLPRIGPIVGSITNITLTNCWYAADSTITNAGTGGTNTEGTSTTNATDFYDKTLNVYDNQVPYWDFATIWKENVSSFPTFLPESVPSRAFQAILF